VRWERLDDELSYEASRLDRDVVAPDQIRTVLRTYKDALFTQLFPGRTEVPKTLIFAKDDSHAEAIVEAVREVFGRGNQFAQKITYKVTGVKPEKLIQDFRISYYPRIAVTVDMISTGTDIKPLEVLLFMRSVKSEGFFEQMKGRGTRTISDTDFQAVAPDARSKTHFVLIDAVGICERIKTDDPPLERVASTSFKNLLNSVALGKRDTATLTSLAGRLGRLARRATPEDIAVIEQESQGRSIRDLAAGLVDALNPDKQLEIVQQETGQPYLTLDDPEAKAITRRLIREATIPFDNPDLRAALLKAQQRDEQTLDVVSEDRLLSANWDIQAEEQARQVVTNFRRFIEQHHDEITALEVFYSRPHHAHLRYEDVKQLADAIAAPPLGLSTDRLWQAYETLDRSRVRSTGKNMKHMLTDLVSLVRYTIEREKNDGAMLEPYSETIARRFAAWLEEQERMRGKPFTTEQRQWLELIRDHVAASLTIETEDFEYEPFNQRGGLGRAHQLFGTELPVILQQLNERLVA
jgi:type I restriction enzyme R subunit